MAGTPSKPLAGVHVIVVDDHDDTRGVLEQALQFQGALVTSVATAREALAAVGEADVVVSDLVMPREDGVWLLEQINRQPRRIPVIVLTGFTASQQPRLAAAPFALKLLKPVDPFALGAEILNVLARR